MRHLGIVPTLILAALCGVARPEGPLPGGADPEPIATRQTVFSIPFQVSRAQQPAQEPVEVQLHVSVDRGVTWRPHARVAPSAGQFLVRAPGDGEYWFLVRTLDRSGQLRPQGLCRPELRVIVDTTPPKLDLEATRGETGQVTARWKVTDLAPRPESLRLLYRTAPDAQWELVPIDPQQVQSAPGVQSGEATWIPPAGASKLEIRAEVADAAGNPAVSHAQAVPERSLAAINPPSNRSATDQQWRPARRETDPAPPGNAAVQTVQRPATPYPETSPGPRWPYSAPGEAFPASPPASTSPLASPGAPGATVPSQPLAGPVSPSVQSQYVPPAETRDPWAGAGTPAGPGARMVNSRVFELEYELGSPASPGRVELWGTRDGGRTWKSFGQDADGRSPMIVTVPEEGIYGFRVVVSADPRAPAQGPPSGETPDVWIGVDLTRPTARLLSAEPGQGEQSGQLVIRWEAADRLLGARPVSLFYSESGVSGTWAPIAAGLENTGQHVWTLAPATPERFHLRLEVRDEAGNLTVDQTSQAVVVTQRPGGAKIRDVRPVSPAATAPRRYNFG